MRRRHFAFLAFMIMMMTLASVATDAAADAATEPSSSPSSSRAARTGSGATLNSYLADPWAAPGAEVLVRFRAGASDRERAAAHSRAGMLGGRLVSWRGWEAVVAPPGSDLRGAAERYRRDPAVEDAELVLDRRITVIPNDMLLEQWGLHNTGQSIHFSGPGTPDADIDAPEAWDLTRGSLEIIVAVLDTGIDHTLADLSSRLIGGIDLVNGDGLAQDDNGHGTEVGSVIGAIGGNGKAMTGVNWSVRLMPIKVCNASGGCPSSAIIGGIDFAVASGADVINMSFACEEDFSSTWQCPGGPAGSCFSQAEKDAITDAIAAGVVVVEAAGNCGSNIDDSTKAYPCAHDLPGNICAGASDLDDARSLFSNFGTQTVDIGAPGQDIVVLGPTPPGGLFWADGTSFASPMVAGVAALLLSRAELTPEEVHRRLVEEGDAGNNLDAVFDGGRVNAFSAVQDVFLRGLTYATHAPGDVMLLADVTGDGRADLVRGTAGTGFFVAKNNGKKRKFASMNLRSTTSPDTFNGAGDVDGNGLEDIILGGASGLRVLRARNGKGALAPVESWSAAVPGSPALAGDVNGDFLTDVVSFDGAEFDAFLSTGSAFGPIQQGWTSEDPSTFTALVDATGDGRDDLILWNNGGSMTEISVAASSGSLFSASTIWVTSSSEYDFAAAGDFDGDGDGDLAGVDPNTGCIAVFISNGSGYEDPRAWSCPGAASHFLAGLADNSNDGLVDMVIRNTATGAWRLLQAAH